MSLSVSNAAEWSPKGNDQGPHDVLLTKPRGLVVILIFAVKIVAAPIDIATTREVKTRMIVPPMSDADLRHAKHARVDSHIKLIGLPELRSITIFACQMPVCFWSPFMVFAFSWCTAKTTSCQKKEPTMVTKKDKEASHR